MKKIISIILSLVLLLSMTTINSFNVAAENILKSKGGFTYAIIGNKAQIVLYYGKSKTVKVPSEIDGHKVVKIGVDYTDDFIEAFDGGENYGFSKNKYVKKIIVPNTVTQIAMGSFSDCPNLISVNLGTGIDTISLLLFDNCKKLKSIKLPSSVTDIEELAFRNSGLKTISIGKNIEYISEDAFENSKLAKITVSSKNKKYSSKNGVLYNKKKTRLIIYPNYRKGAKFTTPSSVEQIKPYAFSGSKFLKKAVFSKKIKKISTGAFDKCKNLKSLVFKSKKKIKIAPYAFLNCKALKSVTIPKNVVKIATKSFGFTSRLEKNHNDYTYKKIKGFTIKGKKNSAAHKYAKKFKFKFVKK